MVKLQKIREILPQVLARPAFRLMMPEKYRELHALRDHDPIGLDDRSFKPLIQQECLFVHIPKTAGISLGQALFGCMTGGHMSMLDYQTAFEAAEIRRFFKFTFVRNPWDRVASAYYYLKAGGRNDADRADAKKIVAPYRDFEGFVMGYLAAGRPEQKHFRPQYQFLCTSPWGPPKVDFIGRYERLEADFATVSERLGLENRLSWKNRTPIRPRDWRASYSDQTAEIVAQTYAKDIRLFGYTFDPD